ncbi:MAG: hypothetical protein ABWX67_07505 [Allosphingosinicella sp.]
MWTVAQDNLILIVIILVIGLAIALWIFRGRPEVSDGPEGNALQDEFAAATQDVAGEILGVDAHPSIPGPSGPPDNLRLLKGVGPKLAAQLNEFGITRFDQLAGLTETEVALIDKRMGAFEGRIARDRLVEQACYLERGDTDGFEAKFGKLGG